MSDDVLLEIRGLHTAFHSEGRVVGAVQDVTLRIRAGRTLGVVGESGSGKSVTALSVMRLLPERALASQTGTISLLGTDLLSLSNRQMAELRGKDLAMVFQEPMTSLNPVFRVGDQVAEAILAHERVTRREAWSRAVDLLREVGLDDARQRARSFPHQLSGGQKQRVMIAMALSCNPRLLIADEPTTALDVTIQAQILDLLRQLRDRRDMAILFITHDLGVVAEIADEVAVMWKGRLVEHGDVLSIFTAPKHPYTAGLLACRPRLDTPFRILPTIEDFLETVDDDLRHRELTEERTEELTLGGRAKMPTSERAPLVSVRDLQVWFPAGAGVIGPPRRWIRAVDGVGFDVYPGQTLGLVGESGCGKTTVARALLRLVEPRAGTIHFDGQPVLELSRTRLRELRREMQIVFQDPYSSLDPRLTVEQTLTEPMVVHRLGGGRAERRDRAGLLLCEVGLPVDYLGRYPHELSGGERQRVCIARVLAVQPRFVICDESVSALDVSVQAQVLNLLKELQARRGLTYVFISHDLSVVKFMSDVLAVMHAGRIVEMGPSEEVYANPREDYTKALIRAIPRDDVDSIRARLASRS